MKIQGKTMIVTIQDFVQKGLYKEAYKYALNNETNEEEYKQTITCFRYLLGCINGESYQENNYSFNDTPETHTPGIDMLKYQLDIHCQGRIFDELRRLCNKF